MFRKLDVNEEIEKRIQETPGLKESIEKADIEYQFIKHLVSLRKQSGITQVELSKRSGLTQQVISKIETYNRLPTLATLLKYIDSMGLELSVKRKEPSKETLECQ